MCDINFQSCHSKRHASKDIASEQAKRIRSSGITPPSESDMSIFFNNLFFLLLLLLFCFLKCYYVIITMVPLFISIQYSVKSKRQNNTAKLVLIIMYDFVNYSYSSLLPSQNCTGRMDCSTVHFWFKTPITLST